MKVESSDETRQLNSKNGNEADIVVLYLLKT
jgi:hypothetical protein